MLDCVKVTDPMVCVCVWSYSSVQRSDGLQVASLSELHVPDLGEVEDDAPMRFQAATERVNFNTSAMSPEHFLKELFRIPPPPPTTTTPGIWAIKSWRPSSSLQSITKLNDRKVNGFQESLNYT